ncbi:hypothetical protein GRI97_07800 [Altererythrobacter xixiisoli]|uniref:Uncharacterized protein n=2 Tax=Croceibacterium xixiisoli TaxID=1476466 RepID=A0A6I4TWC1_9SPHN|nr:hypothetical protein [Croceibacterium xixiisoli]
MRIESDDSADLDFVLSALMTGAISLGEMRLWCDHAIAVLDDPPEWLLELADFDGPAAEAYTVVGFAPHGYNGSKAALAGIAVERGRVIDETFQSREAALEALRRHPDVAARFWTAFPFA